jgi:methyl-accepting chemotaxis protein
MSGSAKSIRQVLLVMAGIEMVVLCGCDIGRQRPKIQEAIQLGESIDPMRLKPAIFLAADRAFADIAGTAGLIASQTTDRKVRENTLLWKIRAHDMMQSIYMEADPRVSYLLAWTSAAHLRQYVTEGQGQDLFGKQQLLAVKTAKKIEQDMITLGRTYFSDESIDNAIDDIELFAATFAASGTLTPERISAMSQQRGDLYRIITLPMLPIRGIGGVADTPEAIARFTATTQDFSRIIQNLPERSRWHLELLLLEAESLGTVETAVQQMQEIQERLRHLSDIAQGLPADVRKELETFVGAMEQAQPGLQATAVQVAETAKTIQQTLTAADTAIRKAETTAETIHQAIEKLTLTASAWEKTASEVRHLVSDLDEPFADDSRAKHLSAGIRELVNAAFVRCILLVLFIFAMLYVHLAVKTRTKKQKKG